MTRVFHRSLAHDYPVAVSGRASPSATARGATISTPRAAPRSPAWAFPPGRAGGHACPLDSLAYAHTTSSPRPWRKSWRRRCVADAPEGISHVYFLSGGSEAIETALKMARQYFVEIGQPQRRHIIGRRQSYHGNTLGGAGGRTQCGAAGPVCAAADRSEHVLAPYELSRAGARRDAGSLWSPARRRSRTRSSGLGRTASSPSSPRPWAAPPAARSPPRPAISAPSASLRPARHPPHPRRGHVRHGPHRHAARLRAEGVSPDLMTFAKGSAAGSPPSALCWWPTGCSRPSTAARSCSSTAIPISAIRWPARRALPCRR